MSRAIKPAYKEAFHFDGLLALTSILIIVFGYIMVVSSSLHWAIQKDNGNLFDPLFAEPFKHEIVKQLMHISIGISLGYVLAKNIPMRFWEKQGGLLFGIGLLLLIVVLIPNVGTTINGSIRWLKIAGFSIQVSELMKFFAVIYMAGYVSRHHKSICKSAFSLLKPLLLFGFACKLLLMEPDFGSSAVLIIIAMGIMFLAGAQLSQFILFFVILSGAGAILVAGSGYRSLRATSFINPFDDTHGSDYQLSNALIAIGRGEWLGVGLGSGVQKLFYLPEANSDFIFSVIGEELGFMGVLMVILLFATLVWRAFAIAKAAEMAEQRFSAYLCYGIGIWFAVQVFVNMGVNMGILPTKGLTLPLMSYGGSSMIIMCCTVALLFRVHSDAVELNASSPKKRFGAWANQ